MIDPLTIEEFLEHGRTWLQYGPDIVFSFNQQDLKLLIDTYDKQQREIEYFQNALNERDNLIASFAAKVDYYESTVFTEGLRAIRDYNDEISTVKEPNVYKVADILKLNKLMKEALSFYANEENWKYNPADTGYGNSINEDHGDIAREALK